MSHSRSLVLAAFLALTSALGTHAQQTAPQQPDPAVLAAARRALANGQAAQALRSLEPLLPGAPGSRELTELAIEATLALNDVSRANAIYDGFAQASGVESAVVFKPIAVSTLRAVAAEAVQDPRLEAEAFERLARGGDAGAAAGLRRAGEATAGIRSLLADVALVRLGDQAAAKRIGDAVSSPLFATRASSVAEAIGRAGDAALAPVLLPMLDNDDPRARIAAVEALAALGHRDAIPRIRLMLNDPFPPARARTALALTRLGDTTGREIVAAMLQSPVPDVRLRVLEADASITQAVRLVTILDILNDPEPLNRVKAAEALAREDANAAKPYLETLAQDPDPSPRREAARVLETLSPPDLALYRRLMGHSDPWVRLYGAGGALRAAAAEVGSGR